MPVCRNCDTVVVEEYVRAFTPKGMEAPSVCPACEDRMPEETYGRREGNDVRGTRGRRR